MTVQQANQPLPNGCQVEGYTLQSQLSLGGFSIVYRAHDPQGQPVVIKEYLPNALVRRLPGETIPIIAPEHLGAFRHGMKCFFEEGRALAHLNHPNVVRVLNFFRANATVYMVMQYEQGQTLQDMIRGSRPAVVPRGDTALPPTTAPNPAPASAIPLSERFIRGMFARLLNGLREVHAHKLLHLDIKPANIYLRDNGTPVLIDFGAARQILSDDAPQLRSVFTPGYAAPEHHGERAQIGPWSDIYSVGASLYACLAGGPPPAAELRQSSSTQATAQQRWHGQYSDRLLEIIDWCLRLDPLQRPQSVFALQKALVEATPLRPAQSHWLDRMVARFGGRSE